MASPPGNLNQTVIDDNENAELLSNNELLSRSERYLNILQQRMQQSGHAHKIDCNQVEQLLTKKKMLAKIRSVLAQFHNLVSNGHVRGFVYGLFDNDRSYTAASDNLRSWWKKVINLDKNGPRNLMIPDSQTLSLRSLNDLQDTSLSSLVSTLMTVCTPSQRQFPFEAGIPVDWWPTGTEEWLPEIGLSENIEPIPYKKPHDLKKLSKVAVMVAIIKNIQPNFQLMREKVEQTKTLQGKMSWRENDIWLAVLRGEELAMHKNLRLSASSEGESSGTTSMAMAPEPEMAPSSSGSALASQGPIEKSNADGASGGEPEMAPVSRNRVLAQGPVERNGASNRKRISSSEPERVPLSASSTLAQGRVEMSGADGESSGANRRKRPATSVPEIMQGQIVRTAILDENSGQRQKLKGIAADEPVGLLLPNNWQQENFHTGMENVGAANNDPEMAPFDIHGLQLPSSTSSMSYLQYPNNNILQQTHMPNPAFSMPTHQPAEYFEASSSLGIGQVNSSNWASSVVPNVQAPLAHLVPNCPYSPSHGMPVCLGQRDHLVQAEYSTLSTAAGISTPNATVSNHQNESQQARPMSTNQGWEPLSNNIHPQSEQNQAPRAENNILSIGAAAANDCTWIQAETSNAAMNDDPLEQLQSQMNMDMIDLESLLDSFDAEDYMRQLASGEIK